MVKRIGMTLSPPGTMKSQISHIPKVEALQKRQLVISLRSVILLFLIILLNFSKSKYYVYNVHSFFLYGTLMQVLVKSLQLIWKSGTPIWNLWVSAQSSNKLQSLDLKVGHQDNSPNIDHQCGILYSTIGSASDRSVDIFLNCLSMRNTPVRNF